MARNTRIASLALCLLLALAAVAAGASGKRDPNPCLDAVARQQLRCPDLVMKKPFGFRLDRSVRRGRVVLRAGNSIDNIGRGPAELHGVRQRGSGVHMRARQRIYRRGGGRLGRNTNARLYFKYVPGQGRYWKFAHAARFELWRVDSNGSRSERVRRSPKVSYCLRDLTRSRPGRSGSPRRRVYPACNRSTRTRRVTIGTSVGWSDVYPPGYHEQWLDVTGLRGCFAYVETADPRDGIYESNERNNSSQRIVRLPYRQRGARPCPGQRSASGDGQAPAPGGY